MGWLMPIALGLWLVVSGARGDDWAEGLEAYDGGDHPAALAAWRREAEVGNLDAINAIADAYRQGVGVATSPERAAALQDSRASTLQLFEALRALLPADIGVR